MASLLIWCFVWIQVHSSKKSSSWKHFWSNGDRGKKVAVTSRRSNVATSSRRDVPASRRWVNNAEVNKWKRRDVPTLRYLNVATLQRRDVGSRSAPHHLKYEWLRKEGGIRRRTNGEFKKSLKKKKFQNPTFVSPYLF